MSLFNLALNASLEDEVARSETVGNAALEVAKAIAAEAQSTAPVASGAYRNSIVAEPFKGGARVYAGDEKSAWIEFGAPAAGQEARFNLRNAVRKLGYKFGRKVR